MKRPKKSNHNGWIVLDKPYGLSSNRALQKVRSAFEFVKAGHVGTLDPLATGVLPIALGEATKLIPFWGPQKKSYTFEVTWGERRTTDDGEGDIVALSLKRPTLLEIEGALRLFLGDIQQVPPLYSAIKIHGKAAYQYAREKKNIELRPRSVFIEELSLLHIISDDCAQFQLICGSGVYVRSLARDMAHALGTEGYVSSLRRTGVGRFSEAEAVPLEKILELPMSSRIEQVLLSMDAALDDIPVMVFEDDVCDRFYKGQPFYCSSKILPTCMESVILCKDTRGFVCGVLTHDRGVLRPKRMFNYER